MGDKVKALKRENDDLKSQLNDLKKEFQFLKSKMAEQKDYNETAATALPAHRMCSSSAAVMMRSWSRNPVCQKLWIISLVGWIYWQLKLTELTKLSTRCSITVINITWRSWAFHWYQIENLHKTPRNCVWSYLPVLKSISFYQISTLLTEFHSEILRLVMVTEVNLTRLFANSPEGWYVTKCSRQEVTPVE